MTSVSQHSSLVDLIVSYLKDHPNERFKARDIALHLFKTYPDRMEQKRRSAARYREEGEFIGQLCAEIGNSKFAMAKRSVQYTETRPRLFFYEQAQKIEPYTENVILEQSLYKLVCVYLKAEFDVYAKRIDEKTSKNSNGKGYNEWLHPDICGIQPILHDKVLNKSVVQCAGHFHAKKARLWSLEIKRELTKSNVRENFFQTVANSSWATVAYLVAPDIRTGRDATTIMEELEILSNLYGVGVVDLNIEEPTESSLLFMAKERHEIDWRIVNRLYMENKDFSEYVKRINFFYTTGELDDRDWHFS